jgi:NTE family protein
MSFRSLKVGVALGGGGARGIAHVAMLEVLDELGIRPVAIAGTSMGAMIGAAYAAGLEARVIRSHILRLLRNRSEVLAKLLQARVGRFADFVLRGRGNPVLLNPQILLELLWPPGIPTHFESLPISMMVVATDYVTCEEIVYQKGKLVPAVAGSMAIPGLFQPVEDDDRVLIDGGAVNPLPYDLLFAHADIVVAVDVTFGGRSRAKRVPSPLDSMFGAAQIMQGAIIAEKLKRRRPDVLLRPDVARYGLLDFFRAPQILRTAEADKEIFRSVLLAELKSRSVM